MLTDEEIWNRAYIAALGPLANNNDVTRRDAHEGCKNEADAALAAHRARFPRPPESAPELRPPDLKVGDTVKIVGPSALGFTGKIGEFAQIVDVSTNIDWFLTESAAGLPGIGYKRASLEGPLPPPPVAPIPPATVAAGLAAADRIEKRVSERLGEAAPVAAAPAKIEPPALAAWDRPKDWRKHTHGREWVNVDERCDVFAHTFMCDNQKEATDAVKAYTWACGQFDARIARLTEENARLKGESDKAIAAVVAAEPGEWTIDQVDGDGEDAVSFGTTSGTLPLTVKGKPIYAATSPLIAVEAHNLQRAWYRAKIAELQGELSRARGADAGKGAGK